MSHRSWALALSQTPHLLHAAAARLLGGCPSGPDSAKARAMSWVNTHLADTCNDSYSNLAAGKAAELLELHSFGRNRAAHRAPMRMAANMVQDRTPPLNCNVIRQWQFYGSFMTTILLHLAVGAASRYYDQGHVPRIAFKSRLQRSTLSAAGSPEHHFRSQHVCSQVAVFTLPQLCSCAA